MIDRRGSSRISGLDNTLTFIAAADDVLAVFVFNWLGKSISEEKVNGKENLWPDHKQGWWWVAC
jgi:hypothetical protein